MGNNLRTFIFEIQKKETTYRQIIHSKNNTE
jgi:hypothetical protein